MSELASAKKSQMQVQVKKSFYQSFGGINFMEADIAAIGFSNIVSQNVGHRSIQAEYSYADLLKTWVRRPLRGTKQSDALL